MNIAARAGSWSAKHRKKAILGWLAFVVLAMAIGKAVGTDTLSQVDAGNGESQKADRLIEKHFPRYAEEQVLVQGRRGANIHDAAFVQGVREVAARLRRTSHVAEVESPLLPRNHSQISVDGGSAVVRFKVLGDEDQAQDRVAAALDATAAAQRDNPALRIEEFGAASFNKAMNKSFEDDFKKAERSSLPITLAILLIAFGAIVAAGLPLMLGITAVLGTLGLLGPISHVIALDQVTGSVVLLIGLAVGVDYSMFYVRRKIEEREAGRSSDEALEVTAATSGRAVLISGLTVIVAMGGMLFAGNAVFTSFAIATMLVVAVALLGSVSVLPAVLSKLADRVEKGRVPVIARRRREAHGESRLWRFVLDPVLRHPLASLVLGAGLLIALAMPALGLRTASPSLGTLPHNVPIMKTYDRLEAAFPGAPVPATVAVEAPDATSKEVRARVAQLINQALGSGKFSWPVTTSVSPDRSLTLVDLSIDGNGTDKRSEAALGQLRKDIVPLTTGMAPGTRTYVTGGTAQSKDFNDTMSARLPIVFAFVLGLAFVLLLVTFRSIVIPLTAIVLNMLSVGAAYGVLKLIFQDGRLQSLLDYDSIDGIITWLPLFLFVILFGLSMDYHVLVLSRIREGVQRGLSTREAVAVGIKATAGVITSAAVVMIAVFSIFATLGFIGFKMMGVGLAVAVLIDATIVRVVLLPSAMTLLGRWNWYLPERLPSLGRAPRRLLHGARSLRAGRARRTASAR